MRGDVYVTRNLRGQYVVRIEGTYGTQEAAVSVARYVARKLGVELGVRDLLGRIRKRDTVGGNDPRDIPG
jgi:hypothetical protein